MQTNTFAKGSCNCGGIKFSVSVPLDSVFICHCSICRKSTGGTGIAVTVVPSNSLVIEMGQGLIRTWEKPNHDWLTNFCKNCGSPVPGKNDEQHAYIPVGLLDVGHENLEVKHHLFVDSKASWEDIGNQGKQHKGAFTG